LRVSTDGHTQTQNDFIICPIRIVHICI